MKEKSIYNFRQTSKNDNWNWLKDKINDPQINWHFFNSEVFTKYKKLILFPKNYNKGLQEAKNEKNNKLIVSHLPQCSFRIALQMKLLRIKAPHLAFSFNFSKLPRGLEFHLMRLAFSKIDRFVVFSSMEKKLYHQYFGIPLDRIDFIYWGVNSPTIDPINTSIIPGEYICSVGESSRDYKTLCRAAESLPNIQFVLVVRPYNLKNVKLPSNVKVLHDLSFANTMNIVANSEMMVIPLTGGEIPCGHVTIVNAHFLGVPVVITESTGLEDYYTDGDTGLCFKPNNYVDLTEKITELWESPQMREKMSSRAKKFAEEHCTEEHTAQYVRKTLSELF